MDIGSLTGQIAIEDQLTGKLTQITSSVKRFAESFDGALGATAIAAGAIGAAVTGIAISITSLGEKGSVILGVEESFDRLARTAGSTGEELINGLSRGVKDTVDSMVLMESTNRLLSSGMQLSGKDMELMGAVAREMGKATGQDAAGGLNTLSSALLTGNTRSLKRFGIQVDLVKAEKEFAASLGATRSELSYEGKLQADRNAMLAAMKTKLDTLGVSEVSFKEKIMQGKIAIGNWTDSLAKAVAASPQINKALDSIKAAFARVVGSESQKALDFLMTWANRFADGVSEAAPKIATFIEGVKQKISEIWNWLVDFNERWQITNTLVTVGKKAWDLLQTALQFVGTAIEEVKRAWAELPEWLQRLTQGALESAIAIGTYTIAINAVATPFAALMSKLDLGINVIGNLTGAVYNLQNLTWLWQTPIGAVAKAYGTLSTAIATSTIAQVAATTATTAITNAKAIWSIVTIGISDALVALGTRIWVVTGAQAAQATATKLLAGVQAFMRGVVFALSLDYMTLTTAIGGSTFMMNAHRVASIAAASASVALGTALLAIKWVLIPLAAAWAAWEFGKWLGSFASVQRSVIWLAEKLHVISAETAQARREFLGLDQAVQDWGDNTGYVKVTPEMLDFQNRMTQIGKEAGKTGVDLDNFVTDAVRKVHELKDNGATAVSIMTEQLKLLSKAGDNAGLKKLAEEAANLKAQGAQLTPELDALIKKMGEKPGGGGGGWLKTGAEDAESFAQKVKDLRKSIVDTVEPVRVFAAMFEGLSGSQRSSWEIQQKIVGEFDKMIAAGQLLTPQMQETYNAYTANVQAIRAAAAASLTAQNVTAEEVALRQKNGESLIAIAYSYGVTTDSLNAYIETVKQSASDEETVAASRMSAWKAWHDKQQAFYDQGVSLENEYKQKMVASAGETAATRVAAIQKTLQAELDRLEQFKLMGTYEASEIDKQISLRRKMANEEIAIANGTSRTIETRMRAQGVLTRREMQQTALDAIRDYSQMKASGLYSADQIEAAFKRAQEAMDAAAPAEKWRKIAVEVADAFGDMFEGINSNVAQAIHVFARGLEVMVDKSKSGAARIAAAFGTAASVLNSLLGDNKGRRGSAAVSGLSGAAAGVGAGAAIGSIVPGIGTVTGAVVGGIVGGIGGMIGGWNSGGAAKAAENNDATKKIREYQAELVKTYGSLQAIDRYGQILGVDLAAAWGDQSVAGLEHFQQLMEEFKGRMEGLQSALETYGLTWRDLGSEMQQLSFTETAQNLIRDFNLLTRAGADSDLVIRRMGPSLSQLVTDAVQTGVKIPQALQPILEKLIRMGGLTDEAARAMLGLTQTAGPSLGQVTEAAERYGLKLDDLGPKVQQLRITETANQIAADFKTLTEAGVPFEALMKDTTKRVTDTGASFDSMSAQAQKSYLDAGGVITTVTTGMHHDIQDMVTKALASGAELPRAMQPIIEQLIAAGGPNGLVDQFGNALTDVSKLNFAADLSGMFEDLITKLDELIDKIGNGIGGAADRASNHTIVIPWKYEQQGGDGGPDATGRAGGGVIYASGGFRVRGTDTVPAMLTPGERVLTVAENREYERGGGQEFVMAPVIMEGIKVAEAMVITKRRHGLGRGRR